MNSLIYYIFFFVLLPILYFKFNNEKEERKSRLKSYFLLIMQLVGFPLLLIFTLTTSVLLTYLILLILILVLIYKLYIVLKAKERCIFIILFILLIFGFVIYSADYKSPNILQRLQTKVISTCFCDYDNAEAIADKEFDKGNYKKAIKYYSLSLKIKQNSAKTYINRALAKINANSDVVIGLYTGNTNMNINHHKMYYSDDIIRDLTSAIEINPNLTIAYINRGIQYSQILEHALAINDFSKAISLDHNNTDLYLYRAEEYSKLEDFKKALNDCNLAIQKDKNNAAAYYTKANLYTSYINSKNTKYIQNKMDNCKFNNIDNSPNIYQINKKEYLFALSNYAKAISINPKFIDAYYNRAILELNYKDYTSALKDSNKCIQLNPKNTINLMLRVSIMAEEINIEDFYNRCYKEKNITISNNKYYKRMLSSIISDCTSIINLDSKNKDAYEIRGKAKYISGDLVGAKQDIKIAEKLSSNDNSCYYEE